mgnify:CR=1 FL=1
MKLQILRAQKIFDFFLCCGSCAYREICNGNTRVRAQQLTGDPWAEDPGCYLSDEEIA